VPSWLCQHKPQFIWTVGADAIVVMSTGCCHNSVECSWFFNLESLYRAGACKPGSWSCRDRPA
jgi:hypothetical protein